MEQGVRNNIWTTVTYVHLIFSSFSFSMQTAVHEKLEDHIKDVDATQLKEVELVWHGMAEVNSTLEP